MTNYIQSLESVNYLSLFDIVIQVKQPKPSHSPSTAVDCDTLWNFTFERQQDMPWERAFGAVFRHAQVVDGVTATSGPV